VDIEDEDKAPVDIVVALDISGSMLADGKLEECKETLTFMARTLKSGDRFGLVAFSTTASTVIPALFMTPENKKMALQKIQAIHATGQTNLSGGLALAA
jgi:Mg-chelatase subunit ChlD